MKRLITILSVMLLALSCQQEAEQPARFEIEGLEDSYTFAPDLGQRFYFKVISDNVLWEISFIPEDQDWVNASPVRSLGGYETVTLSSFNNDSGQARECTMVITNELGYSKSVNIAQRAE